MDQIKCAWRSDSRPCTTGSDKSPQDPGLQAPEATQAQYAHTRAEAPLSLEQPSAAREATRSEEPQVESGTLRRRNVFFEASSLRNSERITYLPANAPGRRPSRHGAWSNGAKTASPALRLPVRR